MPVPSAVVCVGGAVQDRKLHLRGPARLATSNPGTGSTACGGVARNVAENLARLGVPVALVSRVGADAAGQELLAALTALGVDVCAVTVDPASRTAEYVAVLDPRGDLVIGVADMAVLERISVPDVDAAWPDAGWVFADCNLDPAVLAHLVARARAGTAVRLVVDAVSTPKVTRLPRDLTGVGLLFCNRDEARVLLAHCLGHPLPADPLPDGVVPDGTVSDGPADADPAPSSAGPPDVADQALLAGLLAAGAAGVVLTRGADGVLAADASGRWRMPAVPAHVVDVTGAGDALVGGVLSGLARGRPTAEALALGTLTAALTVESDRSVRPDLGPALLARDPSRRRPVPGPGPATGPDPVPGPDPATGPAPSPTPAPQESR